MRAKVFPSASRAIVDLRPQLLKACKKLFCHTTINKIVLHFITQCEKDQQREYAPK